MPAHSFPIAAFMTAVPHPILVTDTLATAEDRMRTLGVHHLPVLSDVSLVGVLSDHDLTLPKAMGVDLGSVSVGIAMTAGPYVVEPDAALTEVARTMASLRVGSAIVMRANKLLGIMTTADMLTCLSDIAEDIELPSARTDSPGSIRRRIRAEHTELDKLLDDVGSWADRALVADDAASVSAAEVELRIRAQGLYLALLRHMELEDAVLAPALTAAPTYGTLRAHDLVEKHHTQREQLQMALTLTASSDLEHLARALLSLVASVRDDMRDEEARFLDSQALDDGVVASDFVDG